MYENLKNKTVFDFCKDVALLETITECFDKEEYLERIKSASAYNERARAFADLAERTNNKALLIAVQREFAEELKEYQAMCNE